MLSTRARLAGYRTALEEADLPYRPEYVAVGTFYKAESIELGMRLLRLPEPPTAIFAMNDVQALGVYEAAARLGMAIPADLSVVGFDDLDIAAWAGPPLTTVRQPLLAMGANAARLLLEGPQSTDGSVERVDLLTTLVIRESTANYPQLS